MPLITIDCTFRPATGDSPVCAATFDFAQKLMNAKDAAEVLGLQSEYLSRQMQVLSTQVRDLGQSAAKIVVDAAKPKP